MVGIPIDRVSDDLRDWARTLKNQVKLWTVKKFIEMNNPSSVLYEFPEEYRPDMDTAETSDDDICREIQSCDVRITDLLEKGLLAAGEKLNMVYGPRNGEKKRYECTVNIDGSIEVMGERFTSPSYAAVKCINAAGSTRKTENGWKVWKNIKGETLAELREKLIRNMND